MVKNKKRKDNVWLRALGLSLWAFLLSILLGSVFESLEVPPELGVPLLLFVVALGVITDGLGVASTRAKPEAMNAMASRRVFGAKEALWFLRNASRVSSVLNDVVGDVAATISGALAVAVTMSLAGSFKGFAFLPAASLGVGIASFLTVGGKALFKNYSLKHSESIVLLLGKAREVWLRLLRRKREGKR